MHVHLPTHPADSDAIYIYMDDELEARIPYAMVWKFENTQTVVQV